MQTLSFTSPTVPILQKKTKALVKNWKSGPCRLEALYIQITLPCSLARAGNHIMHRLWQRNKLVNFVWPNSTHFQGYLIGLSVNMYIYNVCIQNMWSDIWFTPNCSNRLLFVKTTTIALGQVKLQWLTVALPILHFVHYYELDLGAIL